MKQKANILIIILLYCSMSGIAQNDPMGFELLTNLKKWDLLFKDNCSNDWTQNWTLDGLNATLENSKKGMYFSAGPEERNDAHHAVLWTKESFSGDIKIEYDYTK